MEGEHSPGPLNRQGEGIPLTIPRVHCPLPEPALTAAILSILACALSARTSTEAHGHPLLSGTTLRADQPDTNFAASDAVQVETESAYGLWSVDVEELARIAHGRTPTAARLELPVADAAEGTCFQASPVRQPFTVAAATWTCAAEQRPGDGLLACAPARRWQWRDRADGDAAQLPRFSADAHPVAATDGSVGFDVLRDVLEMLAGAPDRAFGWAVASSGAARLGATGSASPPALRLEYGDRSPRWDPSNPCSWHGFHRIAAVHGQSNVITHGPPGVVYGASGVTVYAIDEATDAIVDRYSTFDKVHALQWKPDAAGAGILYIGDTHDGLILVDTDAGGRFMGQLSHYEPTIHGPEGGPAPAVEGLRVSDPCPGDPTRLAYLADGDGVDIVDVSHPLQPVRVGAFADPSIWYSSAIAIDGECGSTSPRRAVYLGRAGARPSSCPGTTPAGSCARPGGACDCVWSKVDASDPAAPGLEFSAPTGWANVALDLEAADGTLLIAGSGGGLITCGTEPDAHACGASRRHRYGQANWITWLNLDSEDRLVAGYYPEPAGSLAYLGSLRDWVPSPAATSCGDPGGTCGPLTTLWGDNVNDAVVVGPPPTEPAAATLLVSHDDYGIVKLDPGATPSIQTVILGGVTAAAALDGSHLAVADLLYGAAEYTIGAGGTALEAMWSRPGFEKAREGSDVRDVALTADLVLVANAEGVFAHRRGTAGELFPLDQPNGGHSAASAVVARKTGDVTHVFAGLQTTPPTIAAWQWTETGGATLLASSVVDVPRGIVWDLALTDSWVVSAGMGVPVMLLPAQPRAGEPWQAVLSCVGWAFTPHLATGSLPGVGEVVFLAADGGAVAARVDDLLALGVGSACRQDDPVTFGINALLTGEPGRRPRGIRSVAFDDEQKELVVGYDHAGDHPSDVLAINLSDPLQPKLNGLIDLQESITGLDAQGGLVSVTSPDLGTAVYRRW